jgi:hypothetical protein
VWRGHLSAHQDKDCRGRGDFTWPTRLRFDNRLLIDVGGPGQVHMREHVVKYGGQRLSRSHTHTTAATHVASALWPAGGHVSCGIVVVETTQTGRRDATEEKKRHVVVETTQTGRRDATEEKKRHTPAAASRPCAGYPAQFHRMRRQDVRSYSG